MSTLAHRIDSACDRFEAAWRCGSGNPPTRVEDYPRILAERKSPSICSLAELRLRVFKCNRKAPQPGDRRAVSVQARFAKDRVVAAFVEPDDHPLRLNFNRSPRL